MKISICSHNLKQFHSLLFKVYHFEKWENTQVYAWHLCKEQCFVFPPRLYVRLSVLSLLSLPSCLSPLSISPTFSPFNCLPVCLSYLSLCPIFPIFLSPLPFSPFSCTFDRLLSIYLSIWLLIGHSASLSIYLSLYLLVDKFIGWYIDVYVFLLYAYQHACMYAYMHELVYLINLDET